MTGVGSKMTPLKKARIKELTEKGVATSVIAFRLGLSREGVYQHQLDQGLRKVETPRKKGGEL